MLQAIKISGFQPGSLVSKLISPIQAITWRDRRWQTAAVIITQMFVV